MSRATRSVLLRQFGAELLGTTALLFVGVSAVACFFGSPQVIEVLPAYWPRLFLVLLCFGGVICAVIASPLGRISGAHMNPAVSLALFLAGRLPLQRLPMFMLAQLCGAMLGTLLAAALWGRAAMAVDFALTRPSPDFPLWASFAAEFCGNALLLWLVLACSRPALARHTPWLVGIFIWVYGSLTASISGASFNPARSLAPALLSGDFSGLWIYFAAPIAGSLLPVLVCRLLARKGESREPGQVCCGPVLLHAE